MPAFALSLIIWGAWIAVFLAFELTAVFWDGCPWMTLSSTVWKLEDGFWPLTFVILFGLAGLMVHIFRNPRRRR